MGKDWGLQHSAKLRRDYRKWREKFILRYLIRNKGNFIFIFICICDSSKGQRNARNLTGVNFILKPKKLSVYMFSWRKSYYLTHPWAFVKDVYWGIRNLWHRARYGYAYVDAWNMSEAWCRMGANMMLHLAQKSCAYPGYGKFDTPEKWKAHLEDMARRLRRCADASWDEENEYYKSYMDSGLNDKELGAKYYARAKELGAVRDAFVRETFEEIGRNFDLYWD